MIRFAIALLVGMLVFIDAAPAFAQSDERIVVAQETRRRTLFDLLFGEPEAAAPPPVQRQEPRQRAPAASLPPPKPEVEKAPDATRLAVFGDSLAIDLSKALERFYAEDPNLVVINQGVSSSGFVRDDYFDWDRAISEQIAADSFDLAVVIIGINDRQELTVGGTGYAPLTEQWNVAYQARIAGFLGKLRTARKPVVWIGLPPMSKTEYSAAISQISNIQRLASFSGGAEYLDIYERFLGEDGKYSSHGPDVNGQNARMRKDDGIHFSSAGSDKLAFYLSQTIRAFYRGSGVSMAAADPLLGTDAAAMLRPPYQGLGQMKLLEVAGAVISLTNTPRRAADLVTADMADAATVGFDLTQMIEAPVGRADAFGVGKVENPNPK
ncbi:SGNH/GDSL hydrolase family protein [Devosia sp.]|uniref:SGNH/GDSL hydrolase family protein n=1 Tax=Devosia sp. TaxID=1871048 RepID=UPI002FC8F81A